MKTRTALTLTAFALLMTGCGANEAPEVVPEATPEPVAVAAEVAVTGGIVRGVVGDDGLKQYHDIPFAAPPVGERRWAPPGAVQPWEGVRDAAAPGPACMQQGPQGGFYDAATAVAAMDEDCLTLSVWTRAQHVDARLPTMVWIHGGGLTVGSGDAYPGDFLTAKEVVLVTINYRLGPFGFLALADLTAESANGASGNQGLQDQIAALEWVRDNIASFGGNPGNVTIFGESAGSMSVSILQASPRASGLFHRIIGQSGGLFGAMTFRDRPSVNGDPAEAIGASFAAALAGEGADTSLEALRALSAEHVLATYLANPTLLSALAIVDGDVLTDEVEAVFEAGKQADVPVLIGSNADEGTALMPYTAAGFGAGAAGFAAYIDATFAEVKDEIGEHYPASDDEQATASWMDLFGDALFTYPMRAWARAMGTVPSNAYLYWFTWPPPIEDSERYGAFHAAEIGYIFGNLELFGATPTEADRALSERMASIWTQFARTGNPNGEGLPEWPAYTPENEAYMEFGEAVGAKTGLRLAKMELIERAWTMRRENAQASVEGVAETD